MFAIQSTTKTNFLKKHKEKYIYNFISYNIGRIKDLNAFTEC